MSLSSSKQWLCGLLWLGCIATLSAQVHPNVFQPFTYEWSAPNDMRLASGAPGPAYWQQKVDYVIDVTLDDEAQRISGSELVTYHNQSPHTLSYLWLQLDQNMRDPHSVGSLMDSDRELSGQDDAGDVVEDVPFPGGHRIGEVADSAGASLVHRIVGTNLRIDLPAPLAPGETFQFRIGWSYNINDATIEGRSGYERFPEGNFIYEIAQWFPRLCVYSDVRGWQNKPFFGPAEFALEFGDYVVNITVPEDHVVAATGALTNAEEVLTDLQRDRLANVRKLNGKVLKIVTLEEARRNMNSRKTGTKTWKFKAENVRDFAFASSRRFIWDAAMTTVGSRKVLCQSLYPMEADTLYGRYATHTIIHTLQTYSHFSVDYPYPTATAINGPVWGMEYPMICFVGGRENAAGFYSRFRKYRVIGVIMHEVGHNFFPMIVNSDERRWAWMDEGLNSFLEYQTQKTFERHYPFRRGPASLYESYMREPQQDPIMTNPESIHGNGKISYRKVATGLEMLREEIMGQAVFDMAFKEYARRWAFRHPEPEDFFRTMEDASGMDLDWFWRTWFYGTDPVDLALVRVRHMQVAHRGELQPEPGQIMEKGVEQRKYYIDDKPGLRDKYTERRMDGQVPNHPTNAAIFEMIGWEIEKVKPDNFAHVYQLEIENQGGCVTPVAFQLIHADGTRTAYRLPAQIWIKGNRTFRKTVRTKKEAVAILLDAEEKVPDINRQNNLVPNPATGSEIEHVDF